jgi:hypothetical protein
MKGKINFIKTFTFLIIGGLLMAFTEENKGRAKLVFLHERAFWGDQVEIKINNKKVANLASNKYVEIEVDAEHLDIIIDRDNEMNTNAKPEIQANLTAEPDKIYYLKIYREIDYFTNKLYLVRISEQTAKKTMKTMKLEQSPLKNE